MLLFLICIRIHLIEALNAGITIHLSDFLSFMLEMNFSYTMYLMFFQLFVSGWVSSRPILFYWIVDESKTNTSYPNKSKLSVRANKKSSLSSIHLDF